jgi:SARP family transcriptional regulator, regulator of embCAB operon
MRYEILGPLRLRRGEEAAFVGARKVETLLAALLIRSDQVVAGGRLKEEIWGGSPPRRASAAMHVYVSQLRKILAHPRDSASPIVTKPPGYMLQLGPDDELDVHEFEQRLRQGRAHIQQRRHQAACASLKSALDMWVGPALVGVSGGPMIGAFVAYLEDARVECYEMLLDAQLTMGRHRELVGQLQSLISDYPLSEVFYRQLMLALYRSERQAEALRVYDNARRVLQDELGLEPGQPLRELQRSILLADPRLDLHPVEVGGYDRGVRSIDSPALDPVGAPRA